MMDPVALLVDGKILCGEYARKWHQGVFVPPLMYGYEMQA